MTINLTRKFKANFILTGLLINLFLLLAYSNYNFAGLCHSTARVVPTPTLRPIPLRLRRAAATADLLVDPREPGMRRDTLPTDDVLAAYLAVSRTTETALRADAIRRHSRDSDDASYDQALRALRQYDLIVTQERTYTERRLLESRRQQRAERIAVRRELHIRKIGSRPRPGTA